MQRDLRPEDRFYTVDEIAERLHTSRPSIFKGIREGTIPVVRVTNRVIRIPGWWLENLGRERAC